MKKIRKNYKKTSWIGKLSLLIIIIMLLLACFAPMISIHPNHVPSGKALEPPSSKHWLGTDDLGIDLWAQICHGARISMVVGFGSAVLAGVGGSVIGLCSGYFGGMTDRIIMRFSDILIALPDLPVMIVLGAFFGPCLRNVVLAIVLISWTMPARIVRSRVLALKQENYIKVAESYGARFWYLTIKHFLPQLFPVMMVNVIRLIGKAIVAEAGLSFLGLGDPTSKSWGLIIHHALNFQGIYFTSYWKWWLVYPVVAMIATVVAIALLSREAEQIFDTRLLSR
jgi:peptide/nickel transport system permease protein